MIRKTVIACLIDCLATGVLGAASATDALVSCQTFVASEFSAEFPSQPRMTQDSVAGPSGTVPIDRYQLMSSGRAFVVEVWRYDDPSHPSTMSGAEAMIGSVPSGASLEGLRPISVSGHEGWERRISLSGVLVVERYVPVGTRLFHIVAYAPATGPTDDLDRFVESIQIND